MVSFRWFVSPISRDFLFLTIKLNWSDKIFPKNGMWKVALVSLDVQHFNKIHRENSLLTLLFWLC